MKTTMKKSWWSKAMLALTGSAMLALTACGGGAGPTPAPAAGEGGGELSGVIKMAVYSFPIDDGINPATGRNVKGVKTMMEPFLKENPKLKIEFSEVPGDSRKAKWQSLLLSSDVDVLFLDSAIDFYSQGLLMSLDDYAKRDNWKANFMESIWSDNERFTNAADGKLMAMPGGVTTNTVVFDKQLFDDFGVEPLSDKPTGKEILEKAAKLTGINPKTGKQTYGMFYDPRKSSHMMLDYFSDGNGVQMGTIDWANFGNSKLNFDTPQIKKSIQTMIDMKPYLPPGYEIGSGFENWGKEANNVAMCLWCSNMDEAIKNKLTDRYVMTKGVRDKDGKTSYGTARTYSIAQATKNPEAAWAVLKYITGEQGQKFMYENYNELPSWKNSPWVSEKDNPYGKQLMAVVADTKNVLFPPIMFSTIRPWMADIISRANHGQKYDLDKELTQIQEKVNKWVEEQKQVDAQKKK